jgi:hypothetical protein
MGKLHGVPDLPPHYLAREAAFAELKQKAISGWPIERPRPR